MAFRLDLPDLIEVRNFVRASGVAARVRVGNDPDIGKSYFVFVCVDYMPGGDSEYAFHLLERDDESAEETIFWSGLALPPTILKEDRTAILQCVLAITAAILEEHKPNRIQIVTYDPNLPERALVKYQQLLDVFLLSGYKITKTDPYHGRRLWWAEL